MIAVFQCVYIFWLGKLPGLVVNVEDSHFKHVPIFDTAPAALKNEARCKSGQNQQKNNRLANNDLNP